MKLSRILSLDEFGVGLDTETDRITDSCIAPPLVCGSIAVLDLDVMRKIEAGQATVLDDPIPGKLLTPEETLEVVLEMLGDPDRVMIGANLAFDLPVLARYGLEHGVDLFPAIFRALEEGRVYDLQIAEANHAIAEGHLGLDPRTGRQLVNPETGRRGMYSLSMCVSLNLGRQNAKDNDEFREVYGQFLGVPHDLWPEKARIYPVDDARNTVECALAQTGHLPKTTPHHRWDVSGTCSECGANSMGEQCLRCERHRNLCNLREQVYAAFALSLNAGWGLRVDQEKVQRIVDYAERKREGGVGPFVAAGLIRPDGSENRALLKRKIAVAYGSEGLCPTCSGTGKVPADNPRMRQCPDCRGRSAPWKSAGTTREPTVRACLTCDNSGKVRDPKHVVACHGPEGEEVTCDGTGLVLADAVPRAEKGGIAYGGDTLHESGDDFLMLYGDYVEDQKWLDYCNYLRRGREPIAGHGPVCPFAHYKKGSRRLPCPCPGPYRDIPLIPRYDPMKETGRVSAEGKIHQFPRWRGFYDEASQTYIPSFRECIVPDKDWDHSSEDFKAGELVTHSESCAVLVGFSDLGEVLLSRDASGEPMDPHADLAAFTLGVSYEEFIARKKEPRFKDCRQASKPQNFGKPTGMGSPKMVLQQRKQGEDTPHPTGPSWIKDPSGGKDLVLGYKGMRYCIMMGGEGPCGGPGKTVLWWNDRPITPMCRECLERCDELGRDWKRKWRENVPYSMHINHCIKNGQTITSDLLDRWPWLREWYDDDTQLAPGEVMQHFVGRVRGGTDFCSASNSYFQAWLSDISKAAYCRVTRECFDRTVRVPDMLYPNSIRSAYAGMDSPLYGSRAPGFFHDEVFATHPRAQSADGAWRIAEIMRDEMRHQCPIHADAAIVDPALMGPWNKEATKVIHGGKLVRWEPGHDPKTCEECKK